MTEPRGTGRKVSIESFYLSFKPLQPSLPASQWLCFPTHSVLFLLGCSFQLTHSNCMGYLWHFSATHANVWWSDQGKGSTVVYGQISWRHWNGVGWTKHHFTQDSVRYHILPKHPLVPIIARFYPALDHYFLIVFDRFYNSFPFRLVLSSFIDDSTDPSFA